jgi:hypothetical protein
MNRVHADVATMTSYQDGEGAPQRREMELPLDLRDPRKVVRGLDEALQRLADDPGAAGEIVALVGEIESALADTGPVELGLCAVLFVGALETAARVRARLARVDAVTRHRQIARALRKLRQVFKQAVTTAQARDQALGTRRARRVGLVACWGLGSALLVGGVLVVFNGTLDGPAVGFAAFGAFWAMVTAWCETSTKTEMAARAVMAAARSGERLLLCQRSTEIDKLLRRQLWIATDQRLFLANRARRGRPAQLVRSVKYPQITALSHSPLSDSYVNVELFLGSEQLDISLESADAKALLAILCRRTGLADPTRDWSRPEWLYSVGWLNRGRRRL